MGITAGTMENTAIKNKLALAADALSAGLIFALIALTTLMFGGTTDRALFTARTAILALVLIQVPLVLKEPCYFSFLTGRLASALLAFFLLLSVFAVYQSAYPGASVEPFASRDQMIQLVFYLALFIVCKRVFAERGIVRYFFALMGLLTFALAMFGMIQKLSGTTKVYWLYETGTTAFFGPFLYENNFGAFIVLTFPMLLAAAFHRASRPIREWQMEERPKLLPLLASLVNSGAAFFFFIAVLTLVAAFYSQSRSTAILLVLTSFATLLGLGIFYGKKRFLLLVAIGVIGLTAATCYLENGKFLENYKSQQLKDSVSLRLYQYRDALTAAFDKPFTGHGLGTYYIMAPYFITPHPVLLDNEEFASVHANNEYLELMSDAGIAGTVLCGGILAVMLWRGVRTAVKSKSTLLNMVKWQAMFALSLFFVSIGIDSHLRTPAIALLFIVQMALLVRHLGSTSMPEEGTEVPNGQRKGTPTLIRIIAACTLVLGSGALFLYSSNHFRAARLTGTSRSDLIEKATLLEPKNPLVQEKAAEAFDRLADMETENTAKERFLQKSQDHMTRAAVLSPSFPHYWYAVAQFEFFLGDKNKAISFMENAVHRSPSNRLYGLRLLSMYLMQNEAIASPTKKTEYWQKAVKLYWQLMSMQNPPVQRHFESWMFKYDPSQIELLRRTV